MSDSKVNASYVLRQEVGPVFNLNFPQKIEMRVPRMSPDNWALFKKTAYQGALYYLQTVGYR